MWEMIGPEPELLDSKKQLRVPYLGDWEKRRKNGFAVFEDTGKVRLVEKAIRESQELREATKALAPLVAQRIARWHKIAALADEAYLYVMSKPVKSNKDAEALDDYRKFQEHVEDVLVKLDEQWMRIHGINPHDPGAQYLMMAGQVGAAAALTGAAAAGVQFDGQPKLVTGDREMPLPSDLSYDAILMAKHMVDHANAYQMPLPKEMTDEVKPKTTKTQ